MRFAWDDLRYFLAFARAGSMQAAAKALRVHQSTIQRRIAELEESLGRRLVEPHGGGYRLTELGQELQSPAEDVEAAVATFGRRLAAWDKMLKGTIRLTCGSTLAARVQQSGLINEFERRYPGLRVELMISDRYLDLAKGEADIAIRIGEPKDEVLVRRKIVDAPWAVYASRAYVEQHGRPHQLEDIGQHLVVAGVDAIAHYPGAQWLRTVAPQAKIAMRCDNWPALVLAVKSGAGLGALLTFQGDSDSDLICVLDNIDLVAPYYLLMHRDMRHTPRVRAFADFVASEIKAFRALISENSSSA